MNSIQCKEIERHLAWQGMRSLREIEIVLANEIPFTYVLSQSPSGNVYYLSYTKGGYKKMIHISFRRVTTYRHNTIKNGFRNGSNIIFSTVDNLVRYKMKGKGIPFAPLSLNLSA